MHAEAMIACCARLRRRHLCGTCKSKLLSGSVDMKHNGGIRQREIDAGLFLPCCSKPLSDLVIDR
ncbi:2Fe-2S iron-sulfur cluster-binding protein [Ciceribacter sichuanensis]|uniref:2Fe-2S iron-sulfur cluster-binding protein n=1 Tax=Ciceribacter sichuanensis TaxID=2949647 RepID=UPI003158A335